MPVLVTRAPIAVTNLGGWEASHGPGSEVSVVTDGIDASTMTPTVAVSDLLYQFAPITHAPADSRITSCVISSRVFFPDPGAAIFSRASVDGTAYTGPARSSSTTPIVLSLAEQWAGQVDTVGKYNAAHFGVRANWQSGPPVLCELSASIEFDPHPGGLAALITSWLGPLVAVGLPEMPSIANELWRQSRIRRMWSARRIGARETRAWREFVGGTTLRVRCDAPAPT